MYYKQLISKASIMMLVLAGLVVVGNVTAQEPIWDANTITLERQELAPGVFGVFPKQTFAEPLNAPKPTSGGFIIGEKSILVIESFLNGDLAAQMIAQVREESQLPIRYLVNTSYHGDHSYGNYVFPSGTSIIQHEGTKGYINEHFDKDREFMMQYFGQNRGIEKAIPRTADITIEDGSTLKLDLGGKTVEIHTFGFGQTPGDLYVWEPESRVIFVGNVWVAPKPGLPWLLDGRHEDVLATMKKIRDFLPDDARVVPGHYSVFAKKGLDFKIEYLETLHKEVKNAVKKGLTLEETVAKVKMDEFRGYAIFDWIHPQVNVPNTYNDLTSKR
jgi:glyoxylase-like metal-dependent hydrolase (beta-lactamase superfamily II)